MTQNRDFQRRNMFYTTMRFIGLLVICSNGLASCRDDEVRSRLYREVFKKTEPQLERHKIIQMLKDLRDCYDEDDQYERTTIKRIDKLLKDSEVSESKCDASYFKITGADYSGRADQLETDSHCLQSKVCKKMWKNSLLSGIDSLGAKDKDVISSIVRSMIDANGGRDFEGILLEMPYENAQEGILRFLERKSGKVFSKRTKEDKFNKVFDEWISEPCGRILGNLLPFSDYFLRLSSYTGSLSNRKRSVALEWAKYGEICQKLRGEKLGYGKTDRWDLRKDIFKNLTFRKHSSWCFSCLR